jgi:hypothetical protein
MKAFQNLAFLGLPLALISCSQAAKEMLRVAHHSFGDLPIIDVHTHPHFSAVKNDLGIDLPVVTQSEYLNAMKEAGIVASVQITMPGGSDFADLSEHNVIRCYGVGKKISSSVLEKEIQSKNYKCLKIYLGYRHEFASSPAYRPVYEAARKYKIPVIFHTGDTYSTKGKLKFSDPLTIDEVAVDYPDVKFVIAHLGTPWVQSAAEVAYKNPNVYVDASALLIGDKDLDSEEIATYVIQPIQWAFGYIENPKKFLFGSDWPLSKMKPYVEAYKRAIPQKYWCDVFFKNALEVFDFPSEIRKLECR